MTEAPTSSDPPGPAPAPLRAVLTAVTVPLVLATAVALVVLWPAGGAPDVGAGLGAAAELVDGRVVEERTAPCQGAPPGQESRCQSLRVRLTGGPQPGRVVEVEHAGGTGSPAIETGDRIVLGRPTDVPAGAPADLEYYVADFQRRTPMLLLALLFAGAVVALGRLRGLRALLALGMSLVLLVRFVLPAILEGTSPVAVALVGSAALAVLTLFLAHGISVRTTVALLGTLASLAVTAVLAAVFVGATHLTGLASEEATFLQLAAERINLEGLLLGGIIIGSLGVLDDVTVTQASAVWELRRADPLARPVALYRSALRIGRDHIASTVNTLVLAYAGASLPLLILFTQAQRGLGDVLTGEVVAVEVVRTLVGSVGLVASVPITTALAAVAVTRDTPPLHGNLSA